MNRTSTGHPTRAFAGLTVLLVAWIGARVPVMQARFVGGLAMARGERHGPTQRATPRVKSQTSRADDAATIAATAPPRTPQEPQTLFIAVIPAKAGTPLRNLQEMGPRFHGDDSLNVEVVIPSVPALAAIAPENTTTAPYRSAFDLATAAYAKLATGDRRAGVRLLDAAIAIGDPNAAAWVRDRDALRRHWSGSAYVIARNGGPDLAGRPVLGGGQNGAALTYALDPLARHPVGLTLRGSMAHTDARSGVIAIGTSWRAMPQITLSAERLVALDSSARGAWTLRAAGGRSGHRFGIDTTVYAAAQARADVPLSVAAGFSLHPGVGAWASIQHDTRSVGRIDAGPGVRLRSEHGRVPIELSIDYRVRLTGNAAPGSGPVVTLGTAF